MLKLKNRFYYAICFRKCVTVPFSEIYSYIKDEILIADSFPLEVCKFGRAHFCKAFKFEVATYGDLVGISDETPPNVKWND